MNECTCICLNSTQNIAIGCFILGIKSYLVSVLMQEGLAAKSACLLSNDNSEGFFSMQRFSNSDNFIVASNKRVVLICLKQDNSIETIDNICIFPTNPLISLSLRNDSIFCLETRGVSLIELKDTSISSDERQGKLKDRPTFGNRERDEIQPSRSVQPISRSPVKSQAFEVPKPQPAYSDLGGNQDPSPTTKSIPISFEAGSVSRIYYDSDKEVIIFGGEMVNFMAKDPAGGYKVVEQRIPLSYFSAFTAPSGITMLNDAVSNDLIVLDRQLKEVNRYSGVPDVRKVDSENFKYVHSESGKSMTWVAGPSKLVRIHSDMTMEEVKMFDSRFTEKFKPGVSVVHATVRGRIAALAELLDKGQAVVRYFDGETSVLMVDTLQGESRTV